MVSIGGYEFKNEKLFERAVTHKSVSKNNYERLEFLGDSILDFLVADILYLKQDYDESSLTRIRAKVVSEDGLCYVFDDLNLQKYVKIGKSCNDITNAIKGDVVESLVAVIYLESGLEECKKFITDNFRLDVEDVKDEKSLFQEYAQKNRLKFEYVLDKTEGPAHNLRFFMSLVVNDKVISSASAYSKAEAEKRCAGQALEFIKEKNIFNLF